MSVLHLTYFAQYCEIHEYFGYNGIYLFSLQCLFNYMNIPQFIHSTIGHLSCPQFGAIKNRVGVNSSTYSRVKFLGKIYTYDQLC